MSTNFDRTAQINAIAGNSRGGANWDQLKSQADLIRSELDELYRAIESQDLNEARDGVCDVLFTAYGFGHRAGFPVNEDYGIVCDSNLSKFDLSEKTAEDTKQKYLALGVETYIQKLAHTRRRDGGGEVTLTYYVTKSSSDQVGRDGKSYPKDKYLKSVNFREPEFYDLPSTNLCDRTGDFAKALQAIGAMEKTGVPYSLHTQQQEGSLFRAVITLRQIRKDAKPVDVTVWVYGPAGEPAEVCERVARNVVAVFHHTVMTVIGHPCVVDHIELRDETRQVATVWSIRLDFGDGVPVVEWSKDVV